MSQHDYNIANATGANVRADLNNALLALVSQNSGGSAPATTYAYMLWADTSTGILKMRNSTNSGWIDLWSTASSWSNFTRSILTGATATAWLNALGVSSFIQTLLDDSDAATARATLGILYPPRYIAGLTLSNAADTEHDITVATGACVDSTNAYNMALASAMTKRIDASWAVGNNSGGLFSGTVANATWYHVHLIRKDSDGTIDVGFDTSVTAANKPAGYSYYRRIGAVLTNSSANIINFRQYGDWFEWNSPPLDISDGSTTTSRTLRTLSVPLGVEVEARMYVHFAPSGNTGFQGCYICHPSATDMAAHYSNAPLGAPFGYDNGGNAQVQILSWTNTSSQIASRVTESGRALYIATIGWTDQRGQN